MLCFQDPKCQKQVRGLVSLGSAEQTQPEQYSGRNSGSETRKNQNQEAYFANRVVSKCASPRPLLIASWRKRPPAPHFPLGGLQGNVPFLQAFWPGHFLSTYTASPFLTSIHSLRSTNPAPCPGCNQRQG